jgi:polysaccharide export outer membrane protein
LTFLLFSPAMILTRSILLLVLLGLSNMALNAQDDTAASATEAASTQTRPAPEALSSNYVLRPTDMIRLTVFQEPDLTVEDRVATDNHVTFPLIGRVRVGGLTVAEARDLITELYNRDYLVNPQISLLILQYSERRVHIHGQVGSPGPVLFPPEEDLTLTAAISSRGGYTLRANISSVNIRRRGSDGKDIVMNVNLREILRNPQAMDIKLQDGDIITVPESIF